MYPVYVALYTNILASSYAHIHYICTCTHILYTTHNSCRAGGLLSEDHFRVQCDQIQWKYRYLLYMLINFMCIIYDTVMYMLLCIQTYILSIYEL